MSSWCFRRFWWFLAMRVAIFCVCVFWGRWIFLRVTRKHWEESSPFLGRVCEVHCRFLGLPKTSPWERALLPWWDQTSTCFGCDVFCGGEHIANAIFSRNLLMNLIASGWPIVYDSYGFLYHIMLLILIWHNLRGSVLLEPPLWVVWYGFYPVYPHSKYSTCVACLGPLPIVIHTPLGN